MTAPIRKMGKRIRSSTLPSSSSSPPASTSASSSSSLMMAKMGPMSRLALFTLATAATSATTCVLSAASSSNVVNVANAAFVCGQHSKCRSKPAAIVRPVTTSGRTFGGESRPTRHCHYVNGNQEDLEGGFESDNFFSRLFSQESQDSSEDPKAAKKSLEKTVATVLTTLFMSLSFLTNPLTPHLPLSHHFSASAEDELYAKYGSKPLDTSLVDKNCLIDHCSLQAMACLQDDPDCRKGLTCTAKCMGDNACITGCFARYGDENLDNLLKCTIEDHECIKVAILEGGGDEFGSEPKGPTKTYVAGRRSGGTMNGWMDRMNVANAAGMVGAEGSGGGGVGGAVGSSIGSGKDMNFDIATMEGTWYKVVGYNPNYDCYDCQRNSFSSPEGGWLENLQKDVNFDILSGGILGSLGNLGANRLQVDVEFSMPRLLPDGSPPPPSGVRESFSAGGKEGSGLQSVGYNAYSTHETMVFDNINDGQDLSSLFLGKSGEERLYARTAHSEGEMFGLKFWENWYVIGQNDPGDPNEFKFIYYNGKTRQNTYDGAFVYSRTRTLSPSSMEKVYRIAKEAGMDPDKFCRIRNGCFDDDDNLNGVPNIPMIKEREGLGSPSNPFRGILASTKISQILGVESVAAESNIPLKTRTTISKEFLQDSPSSFASSSSSSASSARGLNKRPWWKEVGDYLENPRRHFAYMDSLREDMDWPEYIKERN